MTVPPATASAEVPRVRVVTLNWNAAELTARCVRSLMDTDWPADRLELVVVDNASIDGSLERLLRWFPTGVRFLVNERNLGFAGGCNTALRDLSGCDYVALVNNDATVDPNWLAPLVQALDDDDGLGACCPKLLFATPFVPVDVTTRSDAEIVEVTVDGLDVTSKCLWGEGVRTAADPTVPLRQHRLIEGRGRLHVPTSAHSTRSCRVALTVRSPDPVAVTCGLTNTVARPDGPLAIAEFTPETTPQWHINNLGTGRQPWHEGIDRRFGEPDDPELGPEDVDGWCGGGVLLRPAYLEAVGLFDPKFFAYYEDTDLSWRGRRAGWGYRTEPRSVLRHLHGGSAGSSSRGFFFLNYRNWLLTALRNGQRSEILAALRWARHLAWGPTRANVLSPLKHGRVPDTTLTRAWVRVALGVAARALPTAISRANGHAIGLRPTARVRSSLQAKPTPRPPAPRLDGPTVVYVDVTSALESGWRAGIQRVTVELVRHLPVVAEIDVVAVRWSEPLAAYRRLDAGEWLELLEPATTPRIPQPPRLSRRVGSRAWRILTRPPAVGRAVAAVRRWRQPRRHRVLVLPRFEPGSVFFDLDASWNVQSAARFDLLPRLAADGVRIAWFVHDLLPERHPEWFDPGLVSIFRSHLRAHADLADVFICNSRHTNDDLLAFVSDRHPDRTPTSVVVPLGGDPITSFVDSHRPATSAARIPPGVPVVLTVGTIEPRKGHVDLLDAWERIRIEVPDAHLVVVGRTGWHAEEIIARLTRHPDCGSRLHWLTDVDDDNLDNLYRCADLVVVPSLAEGYGLPVVEALTRDCAVVTSNGGALAEVGGDAVIRVPASDSALLADAVVDLFADPERRQQLMDAAAAWEAPSWADTARAVAAALGAGATAPESVTTGSP